MPRQERTERTIIYIQRDDGHRVGRDVKGSFGLNTSGNVAMSSGACRFRGLLNLGVLGPS